MRRSFLIVRQPGATHRSVPAAARTATGPFPGSLPEALAKGKREALSKAEKKELMARVSLRLKKRVLPNMAAFDFSWNLDTMVAYFWSQSAKAVERLSAHFEATSVSSW